MADCDMTEMVVDTVEFSSTVNAEEIFPIIPIENTFFTNILNSSSDVRELAKLSEEYVLEYFGDFNESEVKPEIKDLSNNNDGMVPQINNGIQSEHQVANFPSLNGPRPSHIHPDIRRQRHELMTQMNMQRHPELSTKNVLPDHLISNLDMFIISKFPFQIGINPGSFATDKAHIYTGPDKNFWRSLFLSGLIPQRLIPYDYHKLLRHGIGFTNMVPRTRRGTSELTKKEIKEGGESLLTKLQRKPPRIAIFNGKEIYQMFSGKNEFTFGRQPEKIEGTNTHVWVMPSSFAQCSQLPFYTALIMFRDFLKGTITELTEDKIKESLEKVGDTSDMEENNESSLEDLLMNYCDGSRYEGDIDTAEISRSISQSLYNISGMTREQVEALDCPTIPIRKKRGRPMKYPNDPNDPNAPPRPNKPRNNSPTNLMFNEEEPPKKKRGRPRKVLEDGTIAPPKRPSPLESLVDQIPSLNENNHLPSIPNGSCSNPTTPGQSSNANPLYPGHSAPSILFSPQYSSSSTNLNFNPHSTLNAGYHT